jgi:hypothetical protein
MAQPIPKWHGVVTGEGVLLINTPGLYESYLRRLRNQPVQVTVRKEGRPKSQSQVGYLFGVIYPVLCDHFGYEDYEVNEVHDAVMRELRGLRPEPNPLQARVSLASMTHEEVSAYISDVRHWALMKHGCVTPDATQAEPA